jgi:hypothetical protein
MVWQRRDGVDGCDGMEQGNKGQVTWRPTSIGTWGSVHCVLPTVYGHCCHPYTHTYTFIQRIDRPARAISAHKDDICTSFDKLKPRQSI